ncbi:hypothetical protein C8Q79DRAFT_1007415 [Trametes meyenii]|nr:hypothetical protein C8Q79DRAFT_1007415 [Trametes meyenii]
MSTNTSMSPTSSTGGLLPLPSQLPSLDDTYGALFIGMCVCILLYGLTLHQTYRYFRLYPDDRKWLKVFVLAILIIETGHTAMTAHLCYHYLVTNYFNPSALLSPSWSFRVLAPLSVAAMFLCQSFYIRRVYMIGPQYRWLVAMAMALLLTELGFMIVLVWQAFKGHDVQDTKDVTWVVCAVYGLAVSVDSLVTGVLITVLLKSRTGFKSTDSLIQTLVIYSINSGLVTSIAGMLSFIFALVLSGNMIYTAIAYVATKLYANSVLAVLNTRKSLKDMAMNGFTVDSLQFGGNLEPANSSVVFGQRGTRPVTVSLPPIAEDFGVGQPPEGPASQLTSGDNKV